MLRISYDIGWVLLICHFILESIVIAKGLPQVDAARGVIAIIDLRSVVLGDVGLVYLIAQALQLLGVYLTAGRAAVARIRR